MLHTKGWAVSCGRGLCVGQHSRAPIPQGVQPFVASSQLQQLRECSFCPSSCRAPALPLNPGVHSCSMSGAGVPHGAAGGKTQQMHRPGKSESPPACRDCPGRTVSSAASLPIAPCTGAGGLHQPLRKQQQLLPQPRSCQSRVSSSEQDGAAAAWHRRQLPGQPLQRPVPSGSQADLPIRLRKPNQMPHPDQRSRQIFHLKATISAFQSNAGAPI